VRITGEDHTILFPRGIAFAGNMLGIKTLSNNVFAILTKSPLHPDSHSTAFTIADNNLVKVRPYQAGIMGIG
jgi:hypothetical protein